VQYARGPHDVVVDAQALIRQAIAKNSSSFLQNSENTLDSLALRLLPFGIYFLCAGEGAFPGRNQCRPFGVPTVTRGIRSLDTFTRTVSVFDLILVFREQS
jgi:hypothetical protein